MKTLERWPVLAFAVPLVTLLMLVPADSLGILPQRPALRGELQDFAHPVVFAALTLLGTQVLRRQGANPLHTRHYLMLMGVLVAFAAFTEVLQGFTGREQSLADFTGDLLGISVGILWPLRSRAARGGAALAAVLACIPLAWTVSAYLYRHEQFPDIWRADSRLLNRFAIWQEGSYPGLVLEDVPSDWRAYGRLMLTVHNPGPGTASFTVRVHDISHDHRHEDRFNRAFHLAAGVAADVGIPLEDIAAGPAGRLLDLSAVAGIIVFQQAADGGSRVFPTSIRLAR